MIIFVMIFMITLILSMLILMLNYLFSKKINIMRMKSSSFECGFEMFESIRLPFSLQFFVTAILFLVFDIEIIYLFSMIILSEILMFKIWMKCSFFILLILYLGLEFEKNEGSLKWML
uniref:NADH-ubiquinone oxidoreductase chain 3 n=1 Tax=Dinocampus coccinellae TaxID=144245 RepID=A0A343YVC8_9HYME|nr:NADH dehydrogenase subunit 3 [Dinocampus coccinellae]